MRHGGDGRRMRVDRGVRTAKAPARIAVVALCLIGLLAGCGSGGGASTGESNRVARGGDGTPEKKDVVFGILPVPESAPTMIAVQRGLFKREGLDVTTRIVPPGQSTAAIVGGSFDISSVNWIQFLLAVNHGVDLRVVSGGDAGTPGYAGYLVPKSSGIKSVNDLIGQKVGVPVTPGNCDVIALDVLKESGVKEKPQFVNLAVPDMPATLARGGVAAACVPEPTLTAIKSEFSSIFDVFGGKYQGFPIIGYMTSGSFADKNPNTVGALRRALDQAVALINQNPDIVREILPTYTDITPAQAKTITLPTYTTDIDVERVKTIAAMMEGAGLVDGSLNVPIAAPAPGR